MLIYLLFIIALILFLLALQWFLRRVLNIDWGLFTEAYCKILNEATKPEIDLEAGIEIESEVELSDIESENDSESESEEESDDDLEDFFLCKRPYISGFVSIGEKECRRVLKKYFKLPFKTCRPHFLINPLTGANLELDCYEGSLKLAVEYQGRQHYYYTPQFHPTEEHFFKQQERDRLKAALCSRLGIYLIRVPYSIHKAGIEKYILSNLPANLRSIAFKSTS